MELSKQVCTLEQAKRLKELGVSQQAYWCWAYEVEKLHESFNGEVREWEPEYKENPSLCESSMAQWEGLPNAAAYTVAELGEMLPLGYHTATRDFGYDDWLCWDEEHEGIGGMHSFKTEAEARAAMLIHLIKSQSTSIEEVNKKLKQ